MSDPFAKYTTGDTFRPSARWLNALSDLARERDGGDTGGGGADFSRDADRIKIQNVTGSNQPQFAVLGIDQPAITPSNSSWQFNRWLVFNGVAPLSANHAGKFVVLQQPLAVNSIGWGLVDGVTPVTLNTLNTTSQAYAEVTNNNTVLLQAGPSGSARVLWVENTNSASANAVIRISRDFTLTFSGCRVTNTGNQSVSNGSGNTTTITFDTEDFDTDNYHSTSSNTGRLTAPSAGKYLIGGTMWFAGNSVGSGRVMQLRLNGSYPIVRAQSAPNSFVGSDMPMSASVLYVLAAGDYVEMWAQQDSGAALNCVADAAPVTHPAFWIYKVS